MIHLGESSPDVAHVAMGYSPSPQEPEEAQPWAYPLDTVLIRRYVHTYMCVHHVTFAIGICAVLAVLGGFVKSIVRT